MQLFYSFILQDQLTIRFLILFIELSAKEAKCSYHHFVKGNQQTLCGVKLPPPHHSTMREAREKCEDIGASLPDIRSSDENNYYHEIMKVSSVNAFQFAPYRRLMYG